MLRTQFRNYKDSFFWSNRMPVKHQLQGLGIIINQFSRIAFPLNVLYFVGHT